MLDEGTTALASIGVGLQRRGLRPPRGGRWHRTQVARLLSAARKAVQRAELKARLRTPEA